MNLDRSEKLPRVVIIGAGFAGLNAAKSLKKLPVKITLIDKNNHHLFQPLLYQVATAGLSATDISTPIRSIFSDNSNVEVHMEEVKSLHLDQNKVGVDSGEISYDYLIIAAGAETNYFGHDLWKNYAPSLKNLSDAMLIREHILTAFEKAELETDPDKRDEYLTFVLVGAGPTGVEMAGAIAELCYKVLAKDFRKIDPKHSNIILVEAGPRILASFPEHLSMRAHRALESLGVQVHVRSQVENIEGQQVTISGKSIKAANIIWTAGVSVSSLAQKLNTPLSSDGLVVVQADLSLKEHRNVFVIGDMASVKDEKGEPLPGLAPVAIQQGRYMGYILEQRLKETTKTKPFEYQDKGNLATIGRKCAVADLRKIQIGGFFAWILWVIVHIIYLIGFRNRLVVLINWAWAYLKFQRGARIITRKD